MTKNKPESQIISVSPLAVKDYQKLIVSELSSVFPEIPIVLS